MRTGSLNEYSASYLILQCIVGTQSSIAPIADYFRNIQNEFVYSASNLINGIGAEIKEALNDPNPGEKFSNIFLGYNQSLQYQANSLIDSEHLELGLQL